jgi:hypothetical protein
MNWNITSYFFNRLILHVKKTGHSAGAHIVSLLALDPSYFKDAGVDTKGLRGFVSISGLYNVAQPLNGILQHFFDWINSFLGVLNV